MFVVVRNDGYFLSMPGSEHSYTKSLRKAQTFSTLEIARHEACPEGEYAVRLEDLMNKPK